MQNIRCRCGKIVCQVDNMPELPKVEESSRPPSGPAAVILCRHCKRYVVLRFPALTGIQFAADVEPAKNRAMVSP